jgi:beta-glucosidase
MKVGDAYPPGFLWGAATAAHQIEGNNVGSDYWLLEHLAPTNFKEPSGDACDSWNRWREDVALVRDLGLSAYRFSIEWARIEPEEGRFSLAALDHYRRICLELREIDVSPIVTFHHFTSPRWLAARGGWEDSGTPDRFARYCERSAKAIGDLIEIACTINEPNAQVNSYILRGERPFDGEAQVVESARRALGSDRFGSYFMGDSYQVRDICIEAHQKARVAIGSAAPGVRTGMTLALQALERGEGGDALYEMLFERARRPFYEACASDDFLGVQPYNRFRTGPSGYYPARLGVETDQSGHEAAPDVLGAAIREAWSFCGAPILVSEHGINSIDDAQRTRHLAASLEGLRACLADDIPVLGYVHWSLIDNFEWRSGYGPRFGLYAVDRETFARKSKPAAIFYRDLIASARAQGGGPRN